MKGKTRHTNALWLKIMIGVMIMFMAIDLSSGLIAKYQTNYDLKRPCINNGSYCSASGLCNITISYPDGSLLVANKIMTYNPTYFNYTINDTSTTQIGDYPITIACQDGTSKTIDPLILTVTANGNPPATNGIIILFSVIFIVLVGASCYLAVYTIGHLLSLDFDLLDLAFDWGLYFAIITTYAFEKYYFGNLLIEQYFLWFLSIGGVLLILIPILAFVLSITIGSLNKKKIQATQAPARYKLRRGMG